MGLREDAEAARLAGIARRDQDAKYKECEERERTLKRRAQQQEEAIEAGERLGIVFDEGSAVWIAEPPAGLSYLPETFLHLRSDDGVWLRYTKYSPGAKAPVQHRWMVVQKCAHCDRWVHPGGWATSLEALGNQLANQAKTMEKHVSVKHPEK